jgi:uncharacterized membrane protein
MPYKAWLIAWRRQIWPLHLAIFTFAIFAFYLVQIFRYRPNPATEKRLF